MPIEKQNRKGIYWTERVKKWRATVTIDGKLKHLGYFKDFDEACQVQDRNQVEKKPPEPTSYRFEHDTARFLTKHSTLRLSFLAGLYAPKTLKSRYAMRRMRARLRKPETQVERLEELNI